MQLKRNQLVRIKSGTSVRYWGRLARVVTFEPVRGRDGKFRGSVVVVQPRGKTNPVRLTVGQVTVR